ncbi:hypothetical protein CB0940_09072 [Cercospora beticola]|uniref:MARVEL domain-containing protein n=1 Tax=Cercospora beticola TaxID=122368 RepID=A0A2G5HHH7_CERBT|nr:hypothetical protein CB0940_09072 [Cercospora beticola]PIA92001.1 hypothetical protein CB0940_09072 [Cercospora beticola]WPB06651.1 hypothetical protein RHO25_011310 [Cercospora beticola]
MRIPQTKLQRVKAGTHLFQSVLVFVAGCLTLAVMTKSGGYGGQSAFYFALCFFTIPAVIYQVMVPMWSRAWRFNNVWAIATVDVLFAILWFAAAIAVAVWNGQAISKGKTKTETKPDSNTDTPKRADEVIKDGSCKSFAYGSVSKCNVSKATVGLGVVMFLLFALTAAIAIYAIKQHKKTGAVPINEFKRNPAGSARDSDSITDKTADPWSTDTEDLNGSNTDRFGLGQTAPTADREGLLGTGGHRRGDSDTYSHTDAEGMAHPGRRTSYHSTTQTAYAPASYDDHMAPSALSPTGYDPANPNGHLQFPEANYNALR